MCLWQKSSKHFLTNYNRKRRIKIWTYFFIEKFVIRMLGKLVSPGIKRTRKIPAFFSLFTRFYLFQKWKILPLVSSSVWTALTSTQPNWQPSEQHLNPSSQSTSVTHWSHKNSDGRHSLLSSVGGHSPETRHICMCVRCVSFRRQEIRVWKKQSCGLLTHFMSLISFDTPWKHQKASDFLMFYRGYQKGSVAWNGLISMYYVFFI